MSLKLSVLKDGEVAPKLKLNMNKSAKFFVELRWNTEADLDAHALLAYNDGNGAKVSSFDQVLSTYNKKRKNNPDGKLITNPNGSFSTPDGALTHSGDVLKGAGKDLPDETITIEGDKAGSNVNEIPIFVTIHKAQETHTTFGSIGGHASIAIREETGHELARYELNDELGKFNAVQMGSVILGDNGWEFAPVAKGFNGDFNTVLENFS